MAQNYKAGLIITGDASGGIRAIKATEDELGKLNQGFDRGARQSKRFGSDAARAGRQVAEIDKGASVASRGLDVLHGRVTGVAAAIATAFGAGSVVSQARLIADTDSLARSIGIATGELQAWDYAAQQAGLAGGKMGDILKDITERIGEFTAEGTGEAAALFENLNLNIDEMKRLAPDQQLLKIAEAISTLETRGEQISYLERLGSDATLLLPLLDNNAAKLRELTSEAKAMGVSMSQIDINNALEANRAISELSGTVEGLKNQVVADLGPGLATTVDHLSSFIQEAGGASRILNEVKDVATVTAAIMAGRYAAAFVASAQEVKANTAATIANTQADIAATTAARAKAAETLRVAVAEQDAARRALANGHAIATATGNTTLRTKAITQMAAANQRAIAAEAAHTAAVSASTAAVNANAAAMGRGTVAAQAMAGATRVGAGALALIGGPMGAAMLAGGAIYYFREELGLVAPKVQTATERVDDMTSALDANSEAALKNARAMLEAEQMFQRFRQTSLAMEVERQQQIVFDEQEQWDSVGGQQAFGMGQRSESQQKLHDLRVELLDTRKAIEAAGGSVTEIDEKLEQLERTTRQVITPTVDLGGATEAAGKKTQEAARETTTLASSYEDLLDRLNPNRSVARQFAKDQGTLNLALATGRMNTVQYMQAMGRLHEQFQEGQRESEALAIASEDAGQRIANSFMSWETVADNTLRSLDDAGRDTWLGFADGSTDALETVERGFEQTFANIAHMLTTQKLTFYASGMLGLDTSGMPGGAAQGGGFNLGQMGSLKTGWQAVQNGFGGIQWGGVNTAAQAGGVYGNIATNTAANSGGLYANAATGQAIGTAGSGGLWGGSMQNFSGMQGLGSMGAGYAGGRVGTELGGAIFGKEAGSAYAATAGAAIGTYFGGPLGAFAGGTIGGALDSLFGSSKKTFDFNFEQGKHSYVFGDGTSAFGDYGLTALSDYKLGEQQDELKEMLAALGEFDNQLAAAAIPARFDAMREAIDGFTHSGPEDLFETRLRQMITGGEVWAAEAVASIANPEKLGQAMLGALQLERLGGELGVELSAQIKAAVGAARGDYAADVVQQALASAQAAGVLIDASGRLNLQFDQTAAGALTAAGNLAQYVGGVDSLTAAHTAYYQAAFTDHERLQHSYDDVRAALIGVTDDTPRTVAELRALVEAQSLNGDASQRLAADLMALAPALKETTAAVRQAIEQQYQSALGRAPAGDGLDYWFNLVAGGSLTLEGALWNIANSAEATAAAANGAASGVDGMADALRAREQLERQLLQAQGKTDVLRQIEIDRLSALEVGEVDNLAAMQQRLYALEDEKEAQQAAERAQQERIRAIEQESQAWSRARDQLASFGNNINDWGAQFDATQQSGATPRERLDASDADFWAQYEKALAGDRNARGSITQYADRAIDNLEQFYASSAPGQAGISEIRDAMERLPDMLSPEQFLADEFKGIIGEQTVSLVDVMDLNGSGTVSAIEQAIAADWSAAQLLSGVLNTEMERLGTQVLTEAQVRAALAPHATDAEITRLMRTVDTNGDGIISRQELTNARIGGLSSGIAGSLRGHFDMLDANLDGKLTFGELQRGLAGIATDDELRAIMRAVDLNGSGVISELEAQVLAGYEQADLLKAVLTSEMRALGTDQLTATQVRAALAPHATDAEIERLIRRVDVNGNGIIDQQELTNARISGLSLGIASAVAGQFDSLDITSDGLIDYSEFRNAFDGMATDSELRRIFDKLDVTGTGTISRLDAQTNELITAAKARDLTDTQREIIGALNAQQNESVVRWWGHHISNEFERKFSGHRGLGVTLASKQDESGVNFMGGVFAERMLSRDNTAWLGHQIANEFKRAGVANGGAAYAKGGVFTNSVVSTPTFFNESLMGEAGPEAIMPLSRGAGGRLGIDASGLMTIPEGPLELPMPNVYMPQFPALDNRDVVQVLEDVRRELKETRAENKRLLELIGNNTRDTADAIDDYGQRAEAQRNDQLDELEAISRAKKTRSNTL
ncbi:MULTISPECIES: EF-hand domain-containing protein [unclassified Halomonas]|uniref:EF-hand domain-containing protein n=1 Tax=unclassified Halomonas TaxID=2609666 RepID=UPI0020769C50|nr:MULTISPECIES: EF-hand domain-containing protein [unclassified Halomonas]